MKKRSKVLIVNNSTKLPFDDFIYNRFDKQVGRTFVTIKICDKTTERYVQVLLDKESAVLGVWLLDFNRSQLLSMCKLIFKKFKKIKTITIPFSSTRIGCSIKKNHYDLNILSEDLPEKSTRRKHWREILKQRNDLSKMFGNENFIDYKITNCPREIMDNYFDWKMITHNISYGLSPTEYFKKYHVTDVYVLSYGNKVVSVLLSCEQCSKVYIENISYDVKCRESSPGKLIYIYYLETLFKKGFRTLYLGGGDYEYKTYYGSTKRERYICTVKRHAVAYIPLFLKKFLKIILMRS